MKLSNNIKFISVFALMLGLATSLALAAANPNPRILPINSSAHGAPYGVWSGAWWQWAYSFPADVNPVGDTTGEFASLGQSGPVWFLAGTFGSTVTRTVTIPAGKTLFFPILNTIWINIPELGDNPWSDAQRAYARTVIAPFIDAGANLTCQIDGVEVKDIAAYRCMTPDGAEYMINFPENNVWGLPAGVYGPSIDDGIYLMVTPLPPGEHTIHFTAAAGLTNWKVMGSNDLQAFTDKTADSTITETSPGIYQAMVQVGGVGNKYFMRIAR